MVLSTGRACARALVGATVLIFYATVWSSQGELAAAWIYSIGPVLTLGISFSYNAWPVSRAPLVPAPARPFLDLHPDRRHYTPSSAAPTTGRLWACLSASAVALMGVFLKCTASAATTGWRSCSISPVG